MTLVMSWIRFAELRDAHRSQDYRSCPCNRSATRERLTEVDTNGSRLLGRIEELSGDWCRYLVGISALFVAGTGRRHNIVIRLTGLNGIICIVRSGNNRRVELGIWTAGAASSVHVVALNSRRDARIPTQGHFMDPNGTRSG